MDQINHISYELPYFSRAVLDADGKPDRTKAPVLELDGPRSKDLISTLRAHHMILDPTVALYESFLNTKPLEPGLDHVAPQLREALDGPPAPADKAALTNARWQALMATLRALHVAGVPIVAGTDQAIPGYSLHPCSSRHLELTARWRGLRLQHCNQTLED
jgi:hypothetical protein